MMAKNSIKLTAILLQKNQYKLDHNYENKIHSETHNRNYRDDNDSKQNKQDKEKWK